MGCQNSKDKSKCYDCRNQFETKKSAQHRTPSRSPSRSPGRSPRSARNTPRHESPSPALKYLHRYEVTTDVPLTASRFEKLPPDCIKRNVYRVYDGDTITLRGDDNAKVRLLAMDTPEMQDNEPYAVEARDYTAKWVLDRDVYLGFEGEQKDRYGRYLAYVFAKDKSVPPYKYVCVNIASIEVGLACYYHPQARALSLDDRFLAAQKSAREKKINVWLGVREDVTVYSTAHGKAFHTKTCRSVAHVPLQAVLMSEALDLGHSPCRDCHPNWASVDHNLPQLPNQRREANEGPVAVSVSAEGEAATQPSETNGAEATITNETSVDQVAPDSNLVDTETRNIDSAGTADASNVVLVNIEPTNE